MLTWTGIVVAGILFNSMGAALGSAIMSDAALNDAYNSEGFGHAVTLIFAPLGGFGKFCLAIWWLGSSANLIGNTYSNSIVSFKFLTGPKALTKLTNHIAGASSFWIWF